MNLNYFAFLIFALVSRVSRVSRVRRTLTLNCVGRRDNMIEPAGCKGHYHKGVWVRIRNLEKKHKI